MNQQATHEQVIQLLMSTHKLFQSFTLDDRISLAGREAPPETVADKKVAAFLSNGLTKITPSRSIIVEDGKQVVGAKSEPTWVVDPIDGTIPFMYHIPTYMVSIYEIYNGSVLSAYAFNPNNGDIFYSNGAHSFRNNSRLQVSTHDSLVEARIALSAHAIEMLPELYIALRKAGAYIVLQEGLVFRSTLVANGIIDATIQIELKQFESGTVYSLVTNAGGQVACCTQENIIFHKANRSVIISNSAIHDKLIQFLSEVADITP